MVGFVIYWASVGVVGAASVVAAELWAGSKYPDLVG